MQRVEQKLRNALRANDVSDEVASKNPFRDYFVCLVRISRIARDQFCADHLRQFLVKSASTC